MIHVPKDKNTAIQTRLVQMFRALERVGGTPIDTKTLHSFAFFANVLTPLWDLDPMEGSVLKDEGTPYFPALEKELDALVGIGIVRVVLLQITTDESAAFGGIEAHFVLDTAAAKVVTDLFPILPDEAKLEQFMLELAASFIEIRPDRRDDAAIFDAAYSDPSVAQGRVVDFAEWVSATTGNPAWNTTQQFQQYAPAGVTLSDAEKLAMYMRLMKRRAHG